MANKTAEKISPDTFLNEMNAINNNAKDAVVDLLNKQGNKRYIAVPDWEDECEGDDGAGSELSIFGIGLDDDDEICIAAVVDNIGNGHGPDDFPQEWTKATELYEPNYCAFYRFVANNIDKAMTKEEADELAKKYWNGDGHDYGKYDWHDDCICNGLIKVRLDGKYGFINKDGEEIIPCKYIDADDFFDGLARVHSKEGWGFVNKDGEEIISCKYEDADYFWFGAETAEVKLNGEWITIDKTGKQVTE